MRYVSAIAQSNNLAATTAYSHDGDSNLTGMAESDQGGDTLPRRFKGSGVVVLALWLPLSVSTGGCGFFGIVDYASRQVDTTVVVGAGFTIALLLLQPGNVTMQSCAQLDGRLMQRLPGGGRPQVELVARGAAAEAAVGVSRQVCGERTASAAFRSVQRARAAYLVAPAAHGDKAQQFQHGLKANFSA
jgi:hypothetical protein